MNPKILIAGVALAAVVVLTAIGYALFGSSTKVEYAAKLGEPGKHSTDSRLPELPMHIEFDQANDRIIAKQEDGAIVAWNISSGTRTELARTTEFFAYCRKQQLLLVHEPEGVFLTDLKDNKQRLEIEGTYHHAVWDRDCSTFAIADQGSKEIKHWRTADLSNHLVLYTAEPVRNGLAMSDKGEFIAAAEGTYDDSTGHNTKLEVFTLAEGGSYSRGSPLVDAATQLGMWKMVFTPDGQSLIVGSQTNAKSGLRSIATDTTGERWRKDGFESYWVRAVAASPDGKLIATGDEKGWLRLWNARNGVKLHELQTGLVVQSVSFSDDSRKLAIALWDSTIGILELDGF